MKKLLIAGVCILAACGQQEKEETQGGSISSSQETGLSMLPSEADIARASELTPADEILAAKYDRSCRICHTTPDAAAPLTGHKQGWDKRFISKDANALLKSIKTGLKAMPPMGLCNDCTDEELKALTTFMAGREGS